MDRRYMNGGVSTSHIGRSANSFIPTTSSSHGKLPQSQIQQIALQSQLQAQSQLHMRVSTSNSGSDVHHQNNGLNYYQNTNVSPNRVPGIIPSRSIPNSHSHQRDRGLTRNHIQTKPYNTYGNIAESSSSNIGVINHNSNSNVNGQNIYYGHSPGQTQNQNSSAIPNWRYANQTQPVMKDLPPQGIQPIIKQIQQHNASSKIAQQHQYQPAETEGLPQTLVDSMRTLFDILDDTKVGKIRLSDIETRWESNDVNGSNGHKGNTGAEPLIKMGVMGYLRKVTPSDGMLTFDRFCSGLRLALLTNNNNPMTQSQIFGAPPNQVPHNPQFSLQQHVRNIANNVQNANNIQQNHTTAQLLNKSMPNNSNNDSHSHNNNNTAQRISKIPSVSASRLPTLNSSSVPAVSNSRQYNHSFGSPSAYGNSSSTINAYQNGNNRAQTTGAGEQGTTVAVVHHAPPPNKKPQHHDNSIYSTKNTNHVIGTLNQNKNNSTSTYGVEKRSTTSKQNGSLDNLIVENEGKDRNSIDRPPSAPLLDGSDSYENAKEYQQSKSTNRMENLRRNTKSPERETEAKHNVMKRKKELEEASFGKRVISLVTPRQRTLSMPQLQPNKLKPKLDLDQSSISPDSQSQSGTGNKFQKSNKVESTQSIPVITKLKPESSVPIGTLRYARPKQPGLNDMEPSSPPPKPPRNSTVVPNNANTVINDSLLSGSSNSNASDISPPTKPEIRNVLQTWQKGLADKGTGDLRPDEIPMVEIIPTVVSGVESKSKGDKKTNLRRRETPRRHTVQSGIDFTTLKRLKQLEQERDVLQQGMTYIENTREWYLKQLDMVDEKIGLLTKGARTSESWSECHEERLNLLGCRISEVNNLLAALMDGSTQLPIHMNLQLPTHLSLKTITRLKEQNRQLTQEVSDCGHRVTQLETEKAMLLRQLFHQKNQVIHADETVYM